jgi:hypothetical protein
MTMKIWVDYDFDHRVWGVTAISFSSFLASSFFADGKNASRTWNIGYSRVIRLYLIECETVVFKCETQGLY